MEGEFSLYPRPYRPRFDTSFCSEQRSQPHLNKQNTSFWRGKQHCSFLRVFRPRAVCSETAVALGSLISLVFEMADIDGCKFFGPLDLTSCPDGVYSGEKNDFTNAAQPAFTVPAFLMEHETHRRTQNWSIRDNFNFWIDWSHSALSFSLDIHCVFCF